MRPTSDTAFDLLTLSLVPGVSPRHVRELRTRGSLADALSHSDILPADARRSLSSGEPRRRAEEELSRSHTLGVQIVGLDDPSYPAFLSQIYDPPPVLWVRGTVVPG